MPGGEVSVVTALHPTGLWITVPVTVGGRVTLLMVLDPGSPISAISPAAEQTLRNHGLLEPRAGEASPHLLTNLTIEGQPLPDLQVRVLSRLARLARWNVRGAPLEVDGLLGLDFLGKFVDVHFNVPTMRLRLIDP